MEDGVACAVRQAALSVETFRLGAVLCSGRRVVAMGRNRNDNTCGLASVHAEMDALWKVCAMPKNARLVVVRLRRDQDYGCSRPCEACMAVLRRRGVRRVTYSTDDPSRPFVTEALARKL